MCRRLPRAHDILIQFPSLLATGEHVSRFAGALSLPQVQVRDIEVNIVNDAVDDATPALHLPAVCPLDEGLHVVSRPLPEFNRLLVVETLTCRHPPRERKKKKRGICRTVYERDNAPMIMSYFTSLPCA